MKLGQLVFGRTVSDIDQRCRYLRKLDGGGLTAGARGLAAPHLTMWEALLHVLALVSQKAADAPDVASRLLSDCRYIRHPLLPEGIPFVEGTPVGAAVLAAMHRQRVGWMNFEFVETGELAWLTLQPDLSLPSAKLLFARRDRDVLGATDDGLEAAMVAYSSLNLTAVGSRFVVSAQVLTDVGVLIAADGRAAVPDAEPLK